MREDYRRVDSRGESGSIVSLVIALILCGVVSLIVAALTRGRILPYLTLIAGIVLCCVYIEYSSRCSFEADDSGVTFKSLSSTQRIEYGEIMQVNCEPVLTEHHKKGGSIRRYYIERLTIVTQRGTFVYHARSIDLGISGQAPQNLPQLLANEKFARLKAFIDQKRYYMQK